MVKYSPEQLEQLLEKMPDPSLHSKVHGALTRTFFYRAYGPLLSVLTVMIGALGVWVMTIQTAPLTQDQPTLLQSPSGEIVTPGELENPSGVNNGEIISGETGQAVTQPPATSEQQSTSGSTASEQSSASDVDGTVQTDTGVDTTTIKQEDNSLDTSQSASFTGSSQKTGTGSETQEEHTQQKSRYEERFTQ